MNLDFYSGKRVLVTGHTGFKGSWLCKILLKAGADVTGYSLMPSEKQSLYNLLELDGAINSVIGDIRDINHLKSVYDETCPEIVIHLAAQPLVRESYKNPVYTYETNVMGTVNICECIRKSSHVKSFLNVTTDKVYQNKEWEWGYRENETLDGYDPYSNSKSCSELVTHSYINSFFKEMGIAVSTARAGNVIGGGDFSANRIIPDCVRAALANRAIEVRNADSVRPYQHVLEPLSVYLTILEKQYFDKGYAGFYNVGPTETDCMSTGELVSLFCEYWGENLTWRNQCEKGPHEAGFLRLDCSRIRKIFGYVPVYGIEKAIENTVKWTKVYRDNGDVQEEMDREITEFFQRKKIVN